MKKFILILLIFVIYSEGSSQTKKQPFSSIPFISAYGVYTKNLSDFNDVFPNSAGGYINYSFYFPTNFSLDFRTGYIKQSTTDSTSNSKMQIIPFHIGGRYYFTDFYKGSPVNPYISFMNGINMIIEDIKPNTTLDSNSGIKGRYEFQVGVGVRFFASKKWFFDVNANYNNNFYQTEAMLTGFEYNLGVGYRLK